MKSLTIAYITSRREPKIEWFFDSLDRQASNKIMPQAVLVVDHFANERIYGSVNGRPRIGYRPVEPKPTIWQGQHRITKEDWWAKSNALNTAICLCETEWIAFVDDRCVLGPQWLESVLDAMNGNYAVCGNYEKHYGLKVENGVVMDTDKMAGADNRPQVGHAIPTSDWYGGSGALPLEWCLEVNGFSEDLCDGLGSEDSMFGVTLRNNSGYPIRYDARMLIIEDRTPGQIDGALKRADKGISPKDKSHRIVEIMRDKTTSQNSFDIRNLRDRVLAGEPFPPPSASHLDWFDGASIADME